MDFLPLLESQKIWHHWPCGLWTGICKVASSLERVFAHQFTLVSTTHSCLPDAETVRCH